MTVHEVMMEYLRGLQGEKSSDKPMAKKSESKADPRSRIAVISALRGEKTPKDKNGVPFSRSTTEPYVS